MLIEENRVTFETDNMIVVVENGIIIRLFNALTGTDYIVSSAKSTPAEFSNGLVYAVQQVSKQGGSQTVVGATPSPPKGSKVLVPTLMGLNELSVIERTPMKDQVEFQFRTTDREVSLKISYSIDLVSGDFLIQQKGEGKRVGLSGIRFGVGPITCRGNLLLPVFNGIKACRGDSFYEFESYIWDWPTGWQLPLVIFNDPMGGFWVHTQDTAHRFKEFRYNYDVEGRWNVAFYTINYAPFDKNNSIESVTWRISTYVGDWTGPIDSYKNWAYKAYRIKEKEKLRPEWVEDIGLIITGIDRVPIEDIVPNLDVLKTFVKPEKTMLFLHNWSSSHLLQNEGGTEEAVIPNWVPSEYGIKFNREARKRGFRTMYYSNYFGITPNHPRFKEFEPHLIKNPYTGEFEGWNLKREWSEAGDTQLYYVNPAYKPWRDYQINQFKALFKKSPADALFLDQTFLIFNDGNGLIDGQSMVNGNLDFHKELAEAVSNVALAGESVNEITMQYESFCTIWILSIKFKADSRGNLGWELDPAAFDRMVPLVSRYVLPHTHMTGTTDHETSSPFYAGWRDALHVYSGIPIICLRTVDDLQDPESEVRRVIKQVFRRM